MKALKKPKRKNPYRSNMGFANIYSDGGHRSMGFTVVGQVAINRSGNQHQYKQKLNALSTPPPEPPRIRPNRHAKYRRPLLAS